MSHSKRSHPTSTPINNDKLKQYQLNEMQNSAIGPRNPPQNQCFNAEEGSIIDYEYSLVVPDTQPLPTYKENQDETFRKSPQKLESQEESIVRYEHTKKTIIPETVVNAKNKSLQNLSFHQELANENKCSTPMNTNHANHAARITTNDPLEESQIVISAAKNALITAVDSLNTQNNYKKSKRSDTANDSMSAPSKKKCPDTFVEPNIPPLAFKPKKQIVMVIKSHSSDSSTNRSSSINSNKSKYQRLDLDYMREAFNRTQEHEKKMRDESSSLIDSSGASSVSSNESGIKPKRNIVIKIGSSKPRKDPLKELMKIHSEKV